MLYMFPRLQGEALMHMVMVIGYKITEKEAQMILAMDKGDSTCVFRFPQEEKGAEVRVFVYACDYSLFLHGNPKNKKIVLPDDAWGFRITPYGTTHTATWASIVENIHVKDSQAAYELLGSIAGLPGFMPLSSAWKWAGEWRGRKKSAQCHPQVARPGRSAAPACDVPEGGFAEMRSIRDGELVSSGQVLRALGATYVGSERFLYGVHVVTEVAKRRRL